MDLTSGITSKNTFSKCLIKRFKRFIIYYSLYYQYIKKIIVFRLIFQFQQQKTFYSFTCHALEYSLCELQLRLPHKLLLKVFLNLFIIQMNK